MNKKSVPKVYRWKTKLSGEKPSLEWTDDISVFSFRLIILPSCLFPALINKWPEPSCCTYYSNNSKFAASGGRPEIVYFKQGSYGQKAQSMWLNKRNRGQSHENEFGWKREVMLNRRWLGEESLIVLWIIFFLSLLICLLILKGQ
jgi:hypothetical protein